MIERLANNQFITTDGDKRTFQSYDSIIAVQGTNHVLLSKHYDFSKTTMKYLVKFLGLSSIKEVRNKINSGEYTISIDTEGRLL